MATAKTLQPSPESPDGGIRLDRVRYRHPAFDTIFHGDNPGVTTIAGRSLLNLKGEKAFLRFGMGLFSALAFLEAEHWPWRPGVEDWVLGPGGLPHLKEDASGSNDGATGSIHAALLYRLMAGRSFPDGEAPSSLPSLPRRYPHFSLFNRWMAMALVPPESTRVPTVRELLYELYGIAGKSGYRHDLPSRWGIGIYWEPSVGRWPSSFCSFMSRNTAGLQGTVELAGTARRGARPVELLYLGTPPPYPYAGLEPLMVRTLGSTAGARAWMRQALGKPRAELVSLLTELFDGEKGANWLLWPTSSLDQDSLEVLKSFTQDLDISVTLLDRGAGKSAGAAKRIHLLWLPPVAEGWYLEHAIALLGDDLEKILDSLERLPAGQPSWGRALFPPLPPEGGRPYRTLLGRGGGVEEPAFRRGASPATPAALQKMADEGRLTELLYGAGELSVAKPNEGLFWKSVVLFSLGQPDLALEKCKGLPFSGKLAGKLAVHRARCLVRLGDYPGALFTLSAAASLPLYRKDREMAELIRGQGIWISGAGLQEAQDALLAVEESTLDPDVRTQALCHRATALLHANRVDEAMVLLRRAEGGLPSKPLPTTRFILTHRTAMARRKIGDMEGALQGYEAAGVIAAAFGFRGLQAACDSECGNALRLLCRFEEAAGCYERSVEGGIGLGLDAIAKSATFNLALCTLEGGDPLGALPVLQETAERDSQSKNVVFSAIDFYWLGVAYQQLGRYPEALSEAEHGLKLIQGLPDSGVAVPLMVLRGDILLLAGQRTKLTHLCKKLASALRPETEVDDKLAAAALRLAASKRGICTFPEEEVGAAARLLPSASPYFRSFWHLMAGEDNGDGATVELLAAWNEAREAKSRHLSCRALYGLAKRNALPVLSQREKLRLSEFLTRNRAQGPEKRLLPFLTGSIGVKGKSSEEEKQPSPLLATLAAAEVPSEESMEELLLKICAEGGCLVRGGRGPLWWGHCSAEERRALAAATGLSGEIKTAGGTILGARGHEGVWCGLFRSGDGSFSRAHKAFASVWTRMVSPTTEGEPKPAPMALHPVFSRILITRSKVMESVLQTLQRTAAFSFPVLLAGEPGVGKEVCARALHAVSKRAKKKWVATNCANLTPTLAASLLFGHRKGAFTGADRDRIGLVEAARESTLFLDEVGELPLGVQANLLRFLEDGSFLPLGEVRSRTSNARVVAATNRDLQLAIREGSFRVDLFHRLDVIRIVIPPLRKRLEDIPLLLEHFLAGAAEKEGLPLPIVDSSVLARFAAYPWPGNVRELQNTAKALLVASQGEKRILASHLPERFLHPEATAGLTGSLAQVVVEAQRRAIEEALEATGGNLTAAAKRLGVSRQNLLQKTRKLGIKRR